MIAPVKGESYSSCRCWRFDDHAHDVFRRGGVIVMLLIDTIVSGVVRRQRKEGEHRRVAMSQERYAIS